MSETRPEDEADRAAAPDAPETSAPASEPPAVERRAFLRQLTGEAVVTSARVAGVSSALRRSLFAAVGSVAADPEAAGPDPATPTVDEPQVPPATTGPIASTPPVAPAAPAPVALTATQDAFLAEATTAVLGTNDATGAPHLTASRFHWDGTVIRLPSDLFAARVARIEADRRVSLLVSDDDPDTWVAISGTATVVAGDAAEAGMLLILRKDMTDDEATRAWSDLRASGDPAVIEVNPARFLWRLPVS